MCSPRLAHPAHRHRPVDPFEARPIKSCLLITAALSASLLFAPLVTRAKDGNATEENALVTVKKGVACIKANPRDEGHADVSNKAGQFIDRDLYRVV